VEKIVATALLVFMLWILVMGSALTLPAVMVLQHFTMVLGGAQ
jgi:uncharacterized membrane-anchored protein